VATLVMLSIVLAMVVIPAFCALRFTAKSGVRLMIACMAIAIVVYFALLIYVAPNFIF
jgi:hypothetical protein